MQSKRRCILMISLAAWFGLSFTILYLVHEEMRHDLLKTGLRVAAAVDVKNLTQLTFTAEDENDPRFQYIARELQHLAMAVQLGWSPARNYVGIYTLRQAGGQFFFGPESIPAGDPMSSAPGTIYEEPPDALQEVFRSGQPVLVGPFRDEYGTFMSIFLPLGEVASPGEGGVVMGVDILFQDWLLALFWNSILPLGLLFAFLFALISAAFALVNNAAVLPRSLSPCLLVLLSLLTAAAWIFFLLQNRENHAKTALTALRQDSSPTSSPSFAEEGFSTSVPTPLRLMARGSSGGDVVRLQGSSTILPMIEAAAASLAADEGMLVLWQGSGAAQGVQALREGLIDIAMLARSPTTEERQDFEALTLGWDALVFVVNERNPLRSISREHLRDILGGKQSVWPEAPLPGSEAIVLVGRQEGRASTALLEEFFSQQKEEKPGQEFLFASTRWLAGANAEVLLWVGGLPNAIGYVSRLDALRFQAAGLPVRILALDGIEPTEDNITNGSYPLVRPLTLLYGKDVNEPVRRVLEWFESSEGRALREKFLQRTHPKDEEGGAP